MKGFVKILVLVAVVYLAIQYYKANYTKEGKQQSADDKAAEDAAKLKAAKEERAAVRKQQYAICHANTYGNPSLNAGEQWNAYQSCTANVDAIYPTL